MSEQRELQDQLYNAIERNEIERINEIIDEGANVNAKSYYRYSYRTPLEHIITNDHSKATRILLSRGADPNKFWSTTPLILCVQKQNLEMAKCLLENGTNACDPGNSKKTPLMWAVEKQDLKMVQLLLDNGAELTTYLSLMEALRRNYSEISSLLIQKCPTLNFFDEKGLTPLIVSLKQKSTNFEIVNTLIKKGADVNKPSLKGDKPIIFAFCASRRDLVELLLKNGAYIDTNCLIKCIQTGDINVLKEIMEFNIDINTCDDKGNFPVMSAIEMRNLEMLRLLVQKGAKLDISDENKDTPFLKAVRSVNLKMVKYLVELGVDIDQKDKDGETALAITLSTNDFSTFDFLVKSGASLDSASEKIEETRKTNFEFAIHLGFLENNKRAELVGMKGQEEAKN